mgnify:CR=1 FL=1
MSQLELRSFCLGPWMTNCHVVNQKGSPRCWIIDASFEPQPMIRAIQDLGLTPEKIILTHAHLDHIAGLEAVVKHWPGTPIYIHVLEREFLTDTTLNLSAMAGMPVVAPEATDTLAHGQVITLDELSFEVRHTPGHSPGGISLIDHAHQTAIVGDTLFAGSIGRYDFPTSNPTDLFRSIRDQLMSLPDDMRVLPGHGPETTIGKERRSNPYLRPQ